MERTATASATAPSSVVGANTRKAFARSCHKAGKVSGASSRRAGGPGRDMQLSLSRPPSTCLASLRAAPRVHRTAQPAAGCAARGRRSAGGARPCRRPCGGPCRRAAGGWRQAASIGSMDGCRAPRRGPLLPSPPPTLARQPGRPPAPCVNSRGASLHGAVSDLGWAPAEQPPPPLPPVPPALACRASCMPMRALLVLPLQHEERPALVPEVADAENLLEELDACGVSGMRVAGASSHRPSVVALRRLLPLLPLRDTTHGRC